MIVRPSFDRVEPKPAKFLWSRRAFTKLCELKLTIILLLSQEIIMSHDCSRCSLFHRDYWRCPQFCHDHGRCLRFCRDCGGCTVLNFTLNAGRRSRSYCHHGICSWFHSDYWRYYEVCRDGRKRSRSYCDLGRCSLFFCDRGSCSCSYGDLGRSKHRRKMLKILPTPW